MLEQWKKVWVFKHIAGRLMPCLKSWFSYNRQLFLLQTCVIRTDWRLQSLPINVILILIIMIFLIWTEIYGPRQSRLSRVACIIDRSILHLNNFLQGKSSYCKPVRKANNEQISLLKNKQSLFAVGQQYFQLTLLHLEYTHSLPLTKIFWERRVILRKYVSEFFCFCWVQ